MLRNICVIVSWLIVLLCSQIPVVVYSLVSLTTLFLRFNRITHVGEGLQNLTVRCHGHYVHSLLLP